MNLFFSIIILIWIVRIVHNVVCFVNLWWVKEYRLDRMLIHAKTDQGKKLAVIRFSGFHVSPKSVFLVGLTLISAMYLYFLLPFSTLVRLFVLDIASFPLTSLLVLTTNLPLRLYHEITIYLAVDKLRNNKKLFVIGVTGSYGKTSTKEYLATILSKQYKVLKTEASKNSAIGIAEVVLRKLTHQHEVFVVEMGAYKKGEIARMCAMVHPQVGIVTAINEQHQDLFGSIVSTMHAKYELIEMVTGKKIVIMNADNMYVREMMRWATKDNCVVWAYTKQQIAHMSYAARIFQISDLIQNASSLTFHISLEGEKVSVMAPLVGIHQVENVTAAIAASMAYGMKLADAVKAASYVSPIDQMMKPVKGVNGSTFIDDTFNNNPEGAIAAIDYLRSTKGKKFLVFQPMIELGEYAISAHRRVGDEAAVVCDDIILTNPNYSDAFGSAKVLGARQAADYLRAHVDEGDTVLFKGKESARVLGLLT